MTIKQVSEHTGFSDHTLRFYEKEGILRDVKRNSSGHRDYNEQEVGILSFLACLKKADMSVKDIKEFTHLLYEGDITVPKRIELLEKQRNIVEGKLKEVQEAFEHLDWKINYYKNFLKENQEIGA